MIAKALALRTKLSKASPVDVEALDRAIREIERQTGFLDDIKTRSGTIKSAAEFILTKTETIRSGLVKQIATLDEQVIALRNHIE